MLMAFIEEVIFQLHELHNYMVTQIYKNEENEIRNI